MKKYEVKLLARAVQDMEKIYRYISETLLEPQTAERIASQLSQEILSLEEIPYRFPERRWGKYAKRGYRQLLVKKFLVVYRINEKQSQVIVVTVQHGSRNF